MKVKLFTIFILMLMLVSGCASRYNPQYVADYVGSEEGYGKPLDSSMCQMSQVDYGRVLGYFPGGVCIMFTDRFVFRTVDVDDNSQGRSFSVKFSEMKSVSLTDPDQSLFGLQQFQFKTSNYVHAVIFRPSGKLGFDNIKAKNFIEIAQKKGALNKVKATFIGFEQ